MNKYLTEEEVKMWKIKTAEERWILTEDVAIFTEEIVAFRKMDISRTMVFLSSGETVEVYRSFDEIKEAMNLPGTE